MDLFLIRHGESFNNALDDVSNRVADPPLTERGRAQAQCLGAFVAAARHLDPAERSAGPPFDQILCSPMLRTLETARPMVEALGLPAQIRTDVYEIGGVWVDGQAHCPGLTRGQMQQHLPESRVPDEVTDSGWWPGGQETATAGQGRAMAVATQLRQRAHQRHAAGQPAERIAIVSHGDFMSAIVKALADHLPSGSLYYFHSNTGIDRYRLDADVLRVRYLNRIDHLSDPDLVSP